MPIIDTGVIGVLNESDHKIAITLIDKVAKKEVLKDHVYQKYNFSLDESKIKYGF